MELDQLQEALDKHWENDDNINEFIRRLENNRERLYESGINISNEQMAVKFVKQMYISGHFDETDLMDWEKKPSLQETYDNAKIYFKEKCKKKIMYRKATAKQMGYANGAKETGKTT